MLTAPAQVAGGRCKCQSECQGEKDIKLNFLKITPSTATGAPGDLHLVDMKRNGSKSEECPTAKLVPADRGRSGDSKTGRGFPKSSSKSDTLVCLKIFVCFSALAAVWFGLQTETLAVLKLKMPFVAGL